MFERIWMFSLPCGMLLCWLIARMALWLSTGFTVKSQPCLTVAVDPSRSWDGHCTERSRKCYWLGGNPHRETRTPKRWVCIGRTINLGPHLATAEAGSPVLALHLPKTSVHGPTSISFTLLLSHHSYQTGGYSYSGGKTWLACFFSGLHFV